MTTYHKLKAENAKLKKDLYHLVNYPKGSIAVSVRFE